MCPFRGFGREKDSEARAVKRNPRRIPWENRAGIGREREEGLGAFAAAGLCAGAFFGRLHVRVGLLRSWRSAFSFRRIGRAATRATHQPERKRAQGQQDRPLRH